jgi:hypothetical protein
MSQENNNVVQLNDELLAIWNDIKNLEVNYYGMDRQVCDICKPLQVDPNKLYLSLGGPAALPTIEGAVAKLTVTKVDSLDARAKIKIAKYLIEQEDRFGVISVNPKAK